MLTTNQNRELLSHVIPWDRQCYQHHVPSTEVAYHPQQASLMAGVYLSPQQPVVYGGQHPTLSDQNIDSQQQSKQLTPLAYNLSQQSLGISHEKDQTLTANPSHTQSVLNTLVGHEPCIHTLNYLEAQLESQIKIAKSQGEQIKVFQAQTAHQKEELKRLKQDCCFKEKTIEALRTQIDDIKKSEVPRLQAVIKEQREELEKLH